jgi:hypothetical protein
MRSSRSITCSLRDYYNYLNEAFDDARRHSVLPEVVGAAALEKLLSHVK